MLSLRMRALPSSPRKNRGGIKQKHLIQFLYLLHHIHFVFICYQSIKININLACLQVFAALLLLIMMTTEGKSNDMNCL